MFVENKRRVWIVIGCIIVIILIASQFVGVHIGIFDSGGGSCISVAFDKMSVITADKIVYRVGDQEITITDPATVRYIADHFVVANKGGLCPSQDNKWMYIYNGDRLVRSMRWRCCEEIVDVYKPDALHWVFPSEAGIGQVELSKDFLVYLDSLIQTGK